MEVTKIESQVEDFDSNIDKMKSYNGNPLLKRSGVQVNWTPDMVQEYLRCSTDPRYFIETYMKIINVDHGLMNFKLHDYQVEMLDAAVDNRFVVLATARQVGKSTVIAGYITWYILFHGQKTIAVLANKEKTAVEILGKVQTAYQHLPAWLQQGVKEWNKGSFVLENDSRVIASATSGDSIRGYAINMILIDEAAFVDNWEEFFTSTFPTISSGKTTKVILVSTPNGLNHFYDIVTGAEKGTNNYQLVKVTWDKVPGRDEKWKQDILKGLNNDHQRFAQENEVEFLGSSGTLIAGWKLKELKESQTIPIEKNEGLCQYEKPIPEHNYTIVVDVSRGKGLDYSAFQVIDTTSMPYRQVMTFRDNMIVPYDYSAIIHRIAKLYNEAAVLVEINDIGQQVADLLWNDMEYDNVLSTENAGRAGKRISSGFGGVSDRGIRTTKSVKGIGCSMLKLLIEQNQLHIYDKDTIDELSTFSKKGVSFEAEPGKHDDLVMGLVLFAWLSDQDYFKQLTDINTAVNLKEMTDEETDNYMLPFIFMSDGQEDDGFDGSPLGSSFF